MLLSIFRNANNGVKLIFTAFIVLVTFLLFNLIGVAIAIPVFDISFADLKNMQQLFDPSNPESLSLIKFFQIFQALGMFVVPAILLSFLLFENKEDQNFGLKKKEDSRNYLLAAFAMFAAMPIINFTMELNSGLKLPASLSELEQSMKQAEEQARVLTEAFLNVNTIDGLLVNILMIAILPAIGEELLFRGVIQKLICRWSKNNHIGIFVTAILFSALHFQFYGFLPRMLMGVFFGYLFVWSGSLWMPMIAHFVNNGMAVLAYFLVNKGVLDTEVNQMNGETNYISLILSSFLLAGLVFYIYKFSKHKQVRLL